MLRMTTTAARKELFKLLANLNSGLADPIEIVSPKGSAVLMSTEEYTGMVETLNILQNKYLTKKIVDGMQAPVKDCTPLEDLMCLGE